MSDPTPSGKSSRIWLLLPLVGLALGFLVASSVWLVTRERALTGISAYASMLRAQGYGVEYKDLVLDGFPFRLHLRADQIRIVTPSGWAFDTDRLEALSLTYGSDRWVIALPAPVTVVRPKGGPLIVKAQSLRASLSDLQTPVWKIGIDAKAVQILTPSGAAAFSLASADRVLVNTRKSPSVRGAAEAMVEIVNGRATPHTALFEVLGEHRTTAALAVRMTASEQFQGLGWSAAGRRWVRARGKVIIDPTSLTGDDQGLTTPGGQFVFDRYGVATGALPLTLRTRSGDVKSATFLMSPGQVRLGEVITAPEPRFF